MSRMVMIKNMQNSLVSVKKPEYGINRQWKQRGQTQALPFETVEQLLWDTGFRNMIEAGILSIESMQDKIDLGLEPEGTTKPTNIIVLTLDKMKELWTSTPLDEFKEYVSNLPIVHVDNLISYAIENDMTDANKATFIKELTRGKDILRAVATKHEMAKIK